MTKICVVKSCRKFSASEKSGIFRFPQTSGTNYYLEKLSDKRRKKWMVVLGLEQSCRWRGLYVCGRHFVSGRPARLTDIKNLDWAPTLNLPVKNGNSSSVIENEGDAKLDAGVSLSPGANKLFNETTLNSADGSCLLNKATEYDQDCQDFTFFEEETAQTRETNSNPSTTFDVTSLSSSAAIENELSKLKEKVEMYRMELQLSHTRCFNLTQQLAMSKKDLNSLENDAKCNYYTGINNYRVLKKLYMFLLPSLEKPYCSLSKDQVFVMTLTRLRLNANLCTLAYEYGVCPNTVSKYYHRTLYIIYECCRYALEPTPLSNLQRHTPLEFAAKYGPKRIFIIDCFEVRCQTPGDIKAAAMHFSNYKQAKTVKFLIAIHPDGTIGFISKGYVGRCSDRELLIQSDFLNVLQKNDIVLADKGFNVKDLIEEKEAVLNIPTFLRNKTQFLPSELEADKQVTTLRIHVERIIGLIRNKYTILANVIDVDSMARFQNSLNVVDLTVHVCCILCNFNKSIIPY